MFKNKKDILDLNMVIKIENLNQSTFLVLLGVFRTILFHKHFEKYIY